MLGGILGPGFLKTGFLKNLGSDVLTLISKYEKPVFPSFILGE
jgi:hypothetical protein